jgi:thioredoxin-dependent peroxiredoxin
LSAGAVKTLKVGTKAPAFSLPSDSGSLIRSKDLFGKPFILYFYPKDNTSGCTQESCDFRDHYSAFRKAGVSIFGISKDSIKSHLGFKAKFSLPFELLSDADSDVCEKFGVWKEKSMYGKKYMGIERTTIVVGADGKVVRVYPKVSVKGHVDEVLKDLGIHE